MYKRTFDAYVWQTLTTKAGFYDQWRRGKATGREFDISGEIALSYAQHINVHGRYHFTLPEAVVQGRRRPLRQPSSASEDQF